MVLIIDGQGIRHVDEDSSRSRYGIKYSQANELKERENTDKSNMDVPQVNCHRFPH